MADNRKVVKVLADELTKAMKSISAKEAYFGTITADMIQAGTMSANRISGGTLILGGVENGNGVLLIRNDDGDEIGKWDKDGITINNGKIVVNGGGEFNSITVQGNSTFAGSLSGATGSFTGSLSGATGTFSGSLTAANTTFNSIECVFNSGGGIANAGSVVINNTGIFLGHEDAGFLGDDPYLHIGDDFEYGYWDGTNSPSTAIEMGSVGTDPSTNAKICRVKQLNLSDSAAQSVANQIGQYLYGGADVTPALQGDGTISESTGAITYSTGSWKISQLLSVSQGDVYVITEWQKYNNAMIVTYNSSQQVVAVVPHTSASAFNGNYSQMINYILEVPSGVSYLRFGYYENINPSGSDPVCQTLSVKKRK